MHCAISLSNLQCPECEVTNYPGQSTQTSPSPTIKLEIETWPGATPDGGKRASTPLPLAPACATHSRMTSNPESHQGRINHAVDYRSGTGCSADAC